MVVLLATLAVKGLGFLYDHVLGQRTDHVISWGDKTDDHKFTLYLAILLPAHPSIYYSHNKIILLIIAKIMETTICPF